jgi:hypothetical protein
MADPSRDEQTGRFLTGNIGGGRNKGSRNKLGEAFLEALHADFVEHGVDAIRKTREEHPEQYVRVIASILPKDLDLSIDTSALSDAELDERIRQLAAAIGLEIRAASSPHRPAISNGSSKPN